MMCNSATRFIILMAISWCTNYSFAEGSAKNANPTPIFESLANELEKSYFLIPDQVELSTGFDKTLKKYNFATVGIVENGKAYSAPALPFDDSGLLLLPNIMLTKSQKVAIFKGEESEDVKPFHVSPNNYTILKSKLYKGSKIEAFSDETIPQGEELVSLDLLCKSQCEKTYGLILLKMGSENMYANIHFSYPSKRDLIGSIFNKNGDLLGFNTIKMDAETIDKKYDRDIYFLISTAELLTSVKAELVSSRKLK
ncbi:MAG TPA: hypothetical protein PK002_01595 [Cellvibrio sp.]|nr:hypothetical protein [Cellvibrio sp.]